MLEKIAANRPNFLYIYKSGNYWSDDHGDSPVTEAHVVLGRTARPLWLHLLEQRLPIALLRSVAIQGSHDHSMHDTTVKQIDAPSDVKPDELLTTSNGLRSVRRIGLGQHTVTAWRLSVGGALDTAYESAVRSYTMPSYTVALGARAVEAVAAGADQDALSRPRWEVVTKASVEAALAAWDIAG